MKYFDDEYVRTDFDRHDERRRTRPRHSRAARSRDNDSSPRTDERLGRLCALAETTLSLSLGSADDARLHALAVQSVSAGPGEQIVVRVVATAAPELTSLESEIAAIEATYHALANARGWLREQLAAELHRKKVPELTFVVLPNWEVEP